MNWRKVWNITARVVTWLLIAFTVTMLAFTIITLAMGRKNATIFGNRAYIVLTDSMSEDAEGGPTFNAGDLIVCREVDPATLVAGDIISFTCMDPDSEAYGQVITHKIKEVTTDIAGDPVFRTYGTTTGAEDQALVYYNHVMGKFSFSIPKVGSFIEWMRTPIGYVLVIGLPFGALIATQVVNVIRAWKLLKASERSEMDAEREKLAAERAQMNLMMEELQRMRAEIGANGTAVAPTPIEQSVSNDTQASTASEDSATQTPAEETPAETAPAEAVTAEAAPAEVAPATEAPTTPAPEAPAAPAMPQLDPAMMQQLLAMMQAQMAQNAAAQAQQTTPAAEPEKAAEQTTQEENGDKGDAPA